MSYLKAERINLEGGPGMSQSAKDRPYVCTAEEWREIERQYPDIAPEVVALLEEFYATLRCWPRKDWLTNIMQK